jgi:hypothetical protein
MSKSESTNKAWELLMNVVKTFKGKPKPVPLEKLKETYSKMYNINKSIACSG